MSIILISDPIPSFNKGEFALLEGIVHSIRRYDDSSHIVLISRDPKDDKKRYSSLCEVVGQYDLSFFSYLLRCKTMIVGHDSSINYWSILLGAILNKPLVIFAGSLGKYKSNVRTQIAKLFLRMVSLITVREEISYNLLSDVGISDIVPTYLTADVAFLLNPCSQLRALEILNTENVSTKKPLIGVTLTREMCERSCISLAEAERYDNAVNKKAYFFDNIIEKYGVDLIFLPHSIGPGKLDDRKVASDVIKQMKYKNFAYSITGDYTPSELKGVIKLCWVFIGERTHSVIAALSQGIPSICLTNRDDIRTHGIIGKSAQQENFVYNVDNFDIPELSNIFEHLVSKHQLIRDELYVITEFVKQRALLNGKLFFEIIKH